MFHELKNGDAAEERRLAQAVHDASLAHATAESPSSTSLLQQARESLLAYKAWISDRCQAAKFDRDVSAGESGSSYFFRPPSSVDFRVSIPNALRPDGTSTTDPAELADLYRGFWGTLYRIPSHDLVTTLPPPRSQPLKFLRLLKHTTTRISRCCPSSARRTDDGQRFF